MLTSNTLRLPLSFLITAWALIATGHALAQQPGVRDIYGADSQRERTPAITVFPEYPSDAQRDRLEGESTVCFRVDSQGEVARPDIRSSTHRVFERPAMKAMRASTFEPLAAGESASPSEVCRVYRFKLNPIPAESTELAAVPGGSTASFAASSANAGQLPATLGLAAAGTAAAASTASGTPAAAATAIPLADPNSARVCRTMKRPGSLIRDTICYTREEQLARQAANDRTMRDLEREQRFRDQVILEAAMKNRYPEGLGPR